MMSRISLQIRKHASKNEAFDDKETYHTLLYEDAPTDGDHPWFRGAISISLLLSDEATTETSLMEGGSYLDSSILRTRISTSDENADENWWFLV